MPPIVLKGYKRKASPSGYGNPRVRFWKKVNKDGPIHPLCGQCWVWTDGKFSCGYGGFYIRGQSRRAHRVSWEFHRGPIPEGQQVLHRCDNPICVNPSHLFLGTHQDNMADMKAKGRAIGNVGWVPSEEHRRRLSERLKGKPLTDAHRQAISAGTKGKQFSEETRKRISEGVKRAKERNRAKVPE